MAITKALDEARRMGVDVAFRTITNWGGQFPRHFHSDLQLIATVRGTGRAEVWPRTITLCPGSVLVICPNQVHTAGVDGEGEWAFHSMHIAERTIGPRLPRCASFLASPGSAVARRTAQVIDLLFAREHGTQFAPAVVALVDQIVAAPADAHTNPIDPRIKKAMELYQQSDQPLSLPTLAAAVELSDAHFSRMFAREMGMTPHAWQVVDRIERAKSALRQGASIRDAANSARFTDASTFSRAFRRVTGQSARHFARR